MTSIMCTYTYWEFCCATYKSSCSSRNISASWMAQAGRRQHYTEHIKTYDVIGSYQGSKGNKRKLIKTAFVGKLSIIQTTKYRVYRICPGGGQYLSKIKITVVETTWGATRHTIGNASYGDKLKWWMEEDCPKRLSVKLCIWVLHSGKAHYSSASSTTSSLEMLPGLPKSTSLWGTAAGNRKQLHTSSNNHIAIDTPTCVKARIVVKDGLQGHINLQTNQHTVAKSEGLQ